MTGSTDNDNYYDFDDDNYCGREGWSKNLHAPKGVHIMNKNERKALSKLKRETGLNEIDLRKEKKFRKVLSDAQKAKGSKTESDRRIINIVKFTTRELKLPVDHPLVKEKIKEELNGNSRHRISCYLWFSNTLTADGVISQYKSLRKKQKNG